MAKGQIIEVDPSTLTIALNVRRDVKLDKEFVASIKQHGVLQPPMVVKTDTGHEVVIGQRRVLAAAQAKLPKIEAYLVTRTEAEAARIVDQLTENEQRQQLSDVERVGGYKELALIGISPADIAKRTSTPRARVDQALAIADSAAASQALSEHSITLDQAAEMVEFEDDKAALTKLRETAEQSPGSFAHVVADLREKRALASQRKEAEAELRSAGITVLKAVEWEYNAPDGYVRLDKFGRPGNPNEPAERADVADVSMLAGRCYKEYSDGYKIAVRYFVAEGAEHGLPQREHSAPVHQETAAEKADRVAREKKWAKEQKDREAREAAKKAAAEVRLAWIRTELLQRKTLPDFVPVVALAMFGYFDGGETGEQAFELAGIPWPKADGEDGESDDVFEMAEQHLRDHPEVAGRFALAQAVLVAEWGVQDRASASTVFYLEQLVEWGYGLSEYEQDIVDAAKKGKKAA